MRHGLVPGLTDEVTFEVTEAMCPAFDGEVVHRVCSTWTLVQYMEVAARKMLMRFLEPHEEGVGRQASCEHLGPAPIGTAVRVVARVTEVSARHLVCETKAYRGAKFIATGRTEQRIFPRDVLKRLLH